jgi:hypothetical protein
MADPSERSPPKYWFPAKRYGWGWGPPITWQGWAVMIAWMAATTVGAVLLAGRAHWVWYAVFIAVMVFLLTAICAWKGEKPRWRWGN